MREGRDPRALARRMAALKALASGKGYFHLPLWEQALHGVELVAVPLLAFVLLMQGGVAAVIGMVLLAVHYPRTSYIAHDVVHGQWGPRNDAKARFMLAAQAFGQGIGAAWWADKHALHHSFPNACRIREDGVLVPIDSDIDFAPWILLDKVLAEYYAVSPRSGWRKVVSWVLPRFQTALFFPFLCLARFNWGWRSFEGALERRKYFEATLVAAHWIIGLCLAGLLTPGPAWTGWLWFFVAQLMGGFIIAFAFVLNHTGMDVYDADGSDGFYDRQARATRNTPSSPFLDWLTGGLNSQIEHHMFPTLPRKNLRKIREATRQAMRESGYTYELLSNSEAMGVVLKTLREAAAASGRPMNFRKPPKKRSEERSV